MSVRSIILMAIALVALIANYSANILSEKFKLSAIAIKVTALVVMVVCVSLIMIFGK